MSAPNPSRWSSTDRPKDILWATRCPLCLKIYTSTSSTASDRRAKWLTHLNWHHSVEYKQRDRARLADEMARTERAFDV